MSKKIAKILVANRGEIAGRIIATAKKMNIATVAIYAQNEEGSPYVKCADEAFLLNGNTLHDTYLNQQQLIDIAIKSGAEAIHPGYGFLSENSEFAQRCIENKIIWIGPSPEVIQLLGNKLQAKGVAEQYGVPVLKTFIGTSEKILSQKEELPYPVIIKPASGGGGKGMLIVRHHNELEDVLVQASRQAKAYFGNDELYVEQYLERARHIEVQLLGDTKGNIIHLYERECTIQRRYQKIVEEAPSPSLTSVQREKLFSYALKLAQGIHYTSAGTVEFLYDNDNFYFLEVNTRIQVEHPVTELITGIDIVKEQINIAQGNALQIEQNNLEITGHAIEVRVYAEDPSNSFMPSPGELIIHNLPSNVRVDSDLAINNHISSMYDPMIAKVSSIGDNRDETVDRLSLALQEFVCEGTITNVSFLYHFINCSDFKNNSVYTKFLDDKLQEILELEEKEEKSLLLIAAYCVIQLNQTADKPVNVWQKIGKWSNQNFDLNIANKNVEFVCYKLSNTVIHLMFNENHIDISNYTLSKNKVSFYLDNKSYKIYYYTNRSGHIVLLYNGTQSIVEPSYIERLRKYKSTNTIKEIDNNKVLSPLTGKLIKLQVEKGKNVKKGDTLAIIESMKMENNIVATKDGSIQEVYVFQGEQVSQNQLLLEVN